MRKTWIILVVLIALALVNSVSAIGDIKFANDGKIVVTFISEEAGYTNEFGVLVPSELYLDNNNDAVPNEVYETGLDCKKDEKVVLYMYVTNEGHRYRTDELAGVPPISHARVTELSDGSWSVEFENLWNPPAPSEPDWNDVVLNVACIPDTPPPPVPEFPTVALPAALIVGMLGAVLFIRRDME